MSLWQQLIAIWSTCEKTVLEVLRHVQLLLKQYTRASSYLVIAIGNTIKANIQITTSYSKFVC